MGMLLILKIYVQRHLVHAAFHDFPTSELITPSFVLWKTRWKTRLENSLNTAVLGSSSFFFKFLS